MKKMTLTLISIMTVVFMTVNQSCDEKETLETTIVDIEFSYTPNPALADSLITFTFEVFEAGAAHDDHGDEHHFELSMVTCEVGTHGGGEHSEMTITHHEAEDHYEGEWTFTATGTYELHFGYMYEGEMFEKEFEVVVSAN